MKYYENEKFTKSVGKTGLITVIICCLIAVGGASWFAVAKYNSMLKDKTGESSKEPEQSYSGEENSYNEVTESEITESTTDANNEVSDVPYQSEIAEEPAEEKSFVLPADGNISKGYSDTALQRSDTYGDMRLHTGIDILCERGSEIKSAGKGTVTAVDESGELGKYIVIDHGNGISAKYCGFDSTAVTVGETVSAGSVIGTLGTVPCECNDKSHIHIEIQKDGVTVSPLNALGME